MDCPGEFVVFRADNRILIRKGDKLEFTSVNIFGTLYEDQNENP